MAPLRAPIDWSMVPPPDPQDDADGWLTLAVALIALVVCVVILKQV